MSSPLQERIAKQRVLNERISAMETELAVKARVLLDLCAKYKTDLAAAYIEREDGERALIGDLMDEAHRKPRPTELTEIDKLLVLLRLP